MRISDWSSDVCSSDLDEQGPVAGEVGKADAGPRIEARRHGEVGDLGVGQEAVPLVAGNDMQLQRLEPAALAPGIQAACRLEERRVGKECVMTCSTRWSQFP